MHPTAEPIPCALATGGRAIALLERSLRLHRHHRVGTLAAAISAAAMLALGWPTRTTAQTFQEFPVPTASSQPQRFAAGPDGPVWFAEFGGNKIGASTRQAPLPSLTSAAQDSVARSHRSE